MLRILSLFILIGIFQRVEAQTSTLALADSLYSVGDYQKAIQVYEAQEKISANVYQKIASAQNARGNLNAALVAYQKAIQQNSNLVVAKANYGKLLRRTFQYQKADSVYTDLIQQYPQNPDFYYQLGLIKQNLKDSEAYLYFEKSLKHDVSHQHALYQLASYYYSQKNFKKTEELTLRGLENNPRNIKMQLLSALNAYTQRNYSSALKRYEKVISLEYTSENVFEKLGMCYYQEGFINPAIDAYLNALKLNSENATAHLYVGKLYLHRENLAEAEKHLLMALLLSKPKLDESYQSLGLTYKGKEDYKKAIYYFNLALEEEPNKMRSQFELAIAADNYYADLNTRLSYYELFVKKFKNHSKAQSFVELANRRIKDLKEEQHLSKKVD